MSDTRSADPKRLFRYVGASVDLDARLTRQTAELQNALDEVRRNCADYCPGLPPIAMDLRDVLRELDRLAGRFLSVAMHFLTADCGGIWPWRCEMSELVYRDLFGRAGPDGPPPPLATLVLLAGGQSLGADDLVDLGLTFLGAGGSVKPAADVLNPFLAGATALLTSPLTRRLAERVADTPAARGVLDPLALLFGSPPVKTAGAGLSGVALLEDVNRLKRDGSPWNAWHRKGVGYIADVAGTGFDATSLACSKTPTLYSCGAAVLTGTAWVAAESWTHRRGLATAASVGSQAALSQVRIVKALASRALRLFGTEQESLIDTIRNLDRGPGLVHLPRTITHSVADVVESAGKASTRMAQGATHVASGGWNWLKRQVTDDTSEEADGSGVLHVTG